jgi:hypothetical protein
MVSFTVYLISIQPVILIETHLDGRWYAQSLVFISTLTLTALLDLIPS